MKRGEASSSNVVTEGKQALVENIDAWAMCLAPPVFIFWNLCYWIAYRPWINRLVSEDTLVTMNDMIKKFDENILARLCSPAKCCIAQLYFL